MKKLLSFVVVLAAAAGGAYYFFVVRAKEVEKPIVNRAPITRGPIMEVVQSTGTLEPEDRVDVGSQVSGVVKEMYADFNSIVKKGDLLAELDPAILEVALSIQQANRDRQLGDIENQKVQLENDQLNLKRAEALFEKGLQNQQQLDQARLAVKNRIAQIENAKRQMVQTDAQIKQAELNLSYTKIYSPVDGVVINRLVDRGQTVQASTTTPQFFQIATDLNVLRLSAGVDEAEIGKVQAGQRVIFKVDAYEQEFEGQVDTVRLNATNNQNVVTYPVWIKVPNPQYKLRPAMTATIRIVIQTAENVLRVPQAALRWKPNNEIYTALGITPPAAGRPLNTNPGPEANAGRSGRDGAPGTNGQGANQQARGGGGREGAGAPGASNGNAGRTGGTGFGGGNTNLTPEQREAMARFGGAGGENRRSGRGGAGGGGRQGRGGGSGRSGVPTQPMSNMSDPQKDISGAKKVDELFEPITRREQPGSVYTYDEATKELKQHNVRIGISDGAFSELVRGEGLTAETQVVTGVILPVSSTNRSGQGNIFGQPNMGGRGPGGGMMPGNFGAPGGGGNRGGGGGGGGGRGGR